MAEEGLRACGLPLWTNAWRWQRQPRELPGPRAARAACRIKGAVDRVTDLDVISKGSPVSHPDDLFPEYPLPWEMSAAERVVLIGLLSRLRPEVAMEVGTHFGGSLQALVAHCGAVHSIDIDPGVRDRLAARFPQVRFHIGPSRELIPPVMQEIAARGLRLGFVLVDGDHSAAGVKSDIEALLRHRPAGPLHLLLHDSFNPDCRKGMKQAAWADCPYVHAVELDFVPGTFHEAAEGGAFARSMWGGFALAVLRPDPRTGPLVLGQSQEALQRVIFRQSAHRLWHKVGRAWRRLAGD